MTLQARITTLAQAVGADIKSLKATAGGAASPVNAMTLTRTGGRITSVTEDGVTTSVTYNADGSVNTVAYPRAGKTRTETYTYASGALTGMNATEA